MKKSIAILVLALYGVLSVGVHVHLHYCCGKLADVHLVGGNDGCCAHHEKSDCTISHSCCSFNQIDLALEDDHYSTSFKILPLKVAEEISIPIISEDINSTKPQTSSLCEQVVKRRLFLEFSSLLLYA